MAVSGCSWALLLLSNKLPEKPPVSNKPDSLTGHQKPDQIRPNRTRSAYPTRSDETGPNHNQIGPDPTIRPDRTKSDQMKLTRMRSDQVSPDRTKSDQIGPNRMRSDPPTRSDTQPRKGCGYCLPLQTHGKRARASKSVHHMLCSYTHVLCKGCFHTQTDTE